MFQLVKTEFSLSQKNFLGTGILKKPRLPNYEKLESPRK